MNLGQWQLNNIYNEDCYKAIKELPDKSVDCIYTDIPYLYTATSKNTTGGGAAFLKE